MTIEVSKLPKTEGYVDVGILDGGGLIGDSKIMHAEGEKQDVKMSLSGILYLSYKVGEENYLGCWH